jgi:hypothetical protein
LPGRGGLFRTVGWPARFQNIEWRFGAVKKLLILALLVLGGLAVWRKVQAQRAELDLWSEATTPDDY